MWNSKINVSDQFDFDIETLWTKKMFIITLEFESNNKALINLPNWEQIIYDLDKKTEFIRIYLDKWEYTFRDNVYSFCNLLDIKEIFDLNKIDLSSIKEINFPDCLYDKQEDDRYINLINFLTKYSSKFINESIKRELISILDDDL